MPKEAQSSSEDSDEMELVTNGKSKVNEKNPKTLEKESKNATPAKGGKGTTPAKATPAKGGKGATPAKGGKGATPAKAKATPAKTKATPAKAKATPAKNDESSSEENNDTNNLKNDSEESSSEEEKDKKNTKTSPVNNEDSDEDSDEDSEDQNQKRKSSDTEKNVAKKAKTENGAVPISSEEPSEIFMGNLSYDVTEDQLRQFFSEGGIEISSLRFAEDNFSKKFKGYGWATVATKEAAQKAVDSLNGSEIAGRPIKLDLSSKKAPKTPNTEPTMTVFIGNCSFNIDDDAVKETFADCGTITSIRWQTDKITGQFKGAGFIDFDSIESAQKAVEKNGIEILGRAVRLDFSNPRPSGGENSRFGGDRRRERSGGRGGGRGRGGDRGGRFQSRGSRGNRGGSFRGRGFAAPGNKKITFD